MKKITAAPAENAKYIKMIHPDRPLPDGHGSLESHFLRSRDGNDSVSINNASLSHSNKQSGLFLFDEIIELRNPAREFLVLAHSPFRIFRLLFPACPRCRLARQFPTAMYNRTLIR